MKKIIAMIMLFTITMGCGKTHQLTNTTPEIHNKETIAKTAIDAEVIKPKSNAIYYYIGVSVLTVGAFVLGCIYKNKIWNAYQAAFQPAIPVQAAKPFPAVPKKSLPRRRNSDSNIPINQQNKLASLYNNQQAPSEVSNPMPTQNTEPAATDDNTVVMTIAGGKSQVVKVGNSYQIRQLDTPSVEEDCPLLAKTADPDPILYLAFSPEPASTPLVFNHDWTANTNGN